MSDKTTELLPCPRRGVDMKLHAINYPWADGEPGWNIWHEDMGEAGKRKCPMEMGCYDTREEAIAAWNTRAELGSEREQQLEDVLRDWIACDPRCANRSCGDCEHDEDDGCGLYRRMYELGVIS